MFARYQLKVFLDSHLVFHGSFTSINRVVKVAARFSDECSIRMYDYLTDTYFRDNLIYEMIKEFKDVEILS